MINKVDNKTVFFSNVQNTIKENIKFIIYIVLAIIIFFLSFQIYLFSKNKKIFELSVQYSDSKDLKSQSEFLETMYSISKDKSFYGLLASMELINNKIINKEYEESYNDYLILLNRKNIDNIYKNILGIQASYNLLNNISSDKILILLSYVDESFESFVGFRLEILYLLSLAKKNNEVTESLYDEIIENDIVSSSIKERVKKINEFEKNK